MMALRSGTDGTAEGDVGPPGLVPLTDIVEV